MRAIIKPSTACGRVYIPQSKSVAHRLLINAAMCDGVSTIRHLPTNEDISATVDCLRALGADIKLTESGDCTVCGIKKGQSSNGVRQLACRESGSTLRFLIPIALLDGIKTEFVGSRRLFERPLAIYRDICADNGFLWEQSDTGVTVCGRLCAGEYSVPGNISSQFITGLLLALAGLDGDSKILLTTEPESNSYIDITIDSLAAFGVTVERRGERELFIAGGQKRRAAQELAVEGDESGAAFFGALNTLGGEVTLDGLNEKTLQGDRVWREMLNEIQKGTPTLSIKDCPDLGPILMAAAAACHGATLTDTYRLKIKESDRGAAMAAELAKCGVTLKLADNSITVCGGGLHAPDGIIDGHNDHRIVMSMAVLLTRVGGEIEGAEAVRKSMPTFWDLMHALGADIKTV
ncbi:MAG: 3-phosphoshikimate 1-carboxyvinyltransferase [Clostridia bacterium]|nr:3-phosphoshikimate 1-carboxyvinyltransferase [Clostridia bacterium]